jgi:hypothetical protein
LPACNDAAGTEWAGIIPTIKPIKLRAVSFTNFPFPHHPGAAFGNAGENYFIVNTTVGSSGYRPKRSP